MLNILKRNRSDGASEEANSYRPQLRSTHERYLYVICIVRDKRYAIGDDNVTSIDMNYLSNMASVSEKLLHLDEELSSD